MIDRIFQYNNNSNIFPHTNLLLTVIILIVIILVILNIVVKNIIKNKYNNPIILYNNNENDNLIIKDNSVINKKELNDSLSENITIIREFLTGNKNFSDKESQLINYKYKNYNNLIMI